MNQLHSHANYPNNLFPFTKSNQISKVFIPVIIIMIFFISMFAVSPHSNSNIQNSLNNSPSTGKFTDASYSTTEQSLNDRLKFIQAVDLNHNLISDGLDLLLKNTRPNDQISIIATLKTSESVPQSLINQFTSLGGKLTYQWNTLGMFAGTMTAGAIKIFAKDNLDSTSPLGLIEQDKQMIKESIPDQLTNLQPYVWGNYRLLGDKNNSIAIFDTGIDTTHPMLANYSPIPIFTNDSVKVVGWYDATNDKSSLPQDFDGHGTHVAAIAAGNPYNDTNANNYLNTTYTASYNDTQTLSNQEAYSTYLNITSPGTITQTYYWIRYGGSTKTYGSGLYLLDPENALVASGISTSNNGSAGTFKLSYSVTSNFGLYQLQLGFYYQDPNSNLEMVAYGSEPFTPQLSVLNASFSGVAPDTKIVGIKVFNNIGDGKASFLVNGINWAINNKNTYHISIASMSIGFPCSANGCTTNDMVASVEIAVASLLTAGIITFVAAGNDGHINGDQIGSPGNVDSVITVGATDSFHNLTYYSSMGPGYNSLSMKPDLTAPGGNNSQGGILSADTNFNDAQGTADGVIPDFQKNDLTSMQGTSMATPYAAGIGSLIIQAMGGYNNWNYSSSDVYKVKQIMLMSTWATNSSSRAVKNIYEGWGEIQADAAIDVVLKSPYVPGTTVSGSISNAELGHKIWGRQVHLIAGHKYNFTLTMDPTLDADLYLYSNTYNSYGNPIILKVSKNNGLGVPEYISFNPGITGNYYIYVKTWMGSGTFHLSSNSQEIPTSVMALSPSSLSFIAGSNQKLSWNVTGGALANYSILQNDAQVKFGIFSNFTNVISYDLSKLQAGSYTFTINVLDYHNNKVSNTISVTVQPGTTAKVKTSPGFDLIALAVFLVLPFLKKRKLIK